MTTMLPSRRSSSTWGRLGDQHGLARCSATAADHAAHRPPGRVHGAPVGERHASEGARSGHWSTDQQCDLQPRAAWRICAEVARRPRSDRPERARAGFARPSTSRQRTGCCRCGGRAASCWPAMHVAPLPPARPRPAGPLAALPGSGARTPCQHRVHGRTQGRDAGRRRPPSPACMSRLGAPPTQPDARRGPRRPVGARTRAALVRATHRPRGTDERRGGDRRAAGRRLRCRPAHPWCPPTALIPRWATCTRSTSIRTTGVGASELLCTPPLSTVSSPTASPTPVSGSSTATCARCASTTATAGPIPAAHRSTAVHRT